MKSGLLVNLGPIFAGFYLRFDQLQKKRKEENLAFKLAKRLITFFTIHCYVRLLASEFDWITLKSAWLSMYSAIRSCRGLLASTWKTRVREKLLNYPHSLKRNVLLISLINCKRNLISRGATAQYGSKRPQIN